MTLLTQVGWAQPWIYDFGTGTGTANNANSGTGNTSFFSSTPTGGGTYRIRIGTAGGSLLLANPGTSLGTGSEVQLNTATSTSTNKFGIYNWSSASTVAYLKAKLRTTSTGNGNLNISLGINTLVTDNNGYANHYNNSLASVTVAYTSGAISSVVRRISGSNSTILSSGFSKDADQIIEIYANNGSASVSYVRAGTSYSLSTKTWDLWVDGTKTVTGAATAGTLASGTALSGFGFFAESSTSNAANIYIDDVEYSNALPSPTISSSGTLSAVNTTYGTASASPTSFTVSGSNMTAGITVTPPAGFEVSTTSDFSSSVGDNSSALTVGSSGAIASTTVYVRLKASATVAGSPYSGNIVLSSTGATNVNVATASSTVSRKSLSVTGLTGDNKTYNGSTSATATGTAELSGVLSVDASNVSLGGTPVYTFASSSVGSAISISTTGYSISGSASGNYSLTQPALSADITTKSLTVTANDVSKTAGVVITGGSGSTAFTSSGLENSETIGSVTIAYGTAGAATGDGATPGVYANQVTPSAATGGTFSSSNYNITYSAGSITVNAAPSNPTIITTGALSAVSTTYGTASASPTSFSVSGTALTDDILVTPPSGFEVSSGSGYSTSLTLTQSGGTVASTTIYVRLAATASVAGSPYSGNIVLSSTGATSQNVATVSSTVTAKALTITGITGSNKEYDRTTTASFTGTAVYSDLANSESFSVSGTPTASFATESVGSNKTITISGYTAPSSNYSLTQPSLLGDITAKALTISSAAASNKTYDENTNATITGSLSGVIGADVVSFSGTGTFASSNAGTSISVTSTATLTGADAGNYSLTQPTGLTADINKANQSITFNALPAKTTADADFAPGATSATSGINAITYSSSNTAVATIVSGNIHIVGAGTSTITASQAGSVNFNAAADVNQTLTVTPVSASLGLYQFSSSLAVSSPNSSLTFANFSANVISGTTSSSYYNLSPSGNWGTAVNTSNYIQFSVTPAAGKLLTITSITLLQLRTTAGATNYVVRSSADSYASNLGSGVYTTTSGSGAPVTQQTVSMSGASFTQFYDGTLTFRIYPYGGSSTGNWRADDVTINGYVEDMPSGPSLTAASSATVDNNFNVTFTDEATWRAAVTAVKYGSTTLVSGTDYDLSSGVLTLKPSGSSSSGLRTSGTNTVSILATKYQDATVSQTVGSGAATKLLISTQPTAPLNNGEVLATQPVVRVADQYDNTTSSTAIVDASVGSGTWTLGGSSSPAAVSGTATFTNLTATSAAAVTGATISFASTGMTGVTSSAFNIPAPPRAEPSEHPTSFAAALGSPSYSAINLSWTDAGGSVAPDGYLIKGSTVSFASITDPIDGTAVSDAGLNKNIAQGVQAATFTGLTSNTTYYFKIYSYTNAGSLINYKLDGVIQQSSATTDRSTSSADYFRSKASGTWTTPGTWESSSDGTNNWITATAAPTSAATAITVQNGHTLTISSAVTIDKTTVANGGILKLVNDGAVSQSGAITLANGDTDQLTIQSGGTLQVVVLSSLAAYSYTTLVNYQTSGNINVNSGGKISIGDGTALHTGSGYSEFGYGASTKVTWNDGAIFDINSTGDFILSTSNRTFFPSVSSSISPIFRISALTGNPGGASPTVINGIFEANMGITWTGAGTKTFRNGISGTGNVTQADGCGQFILSGTAQIGGSGTLTLEANDLSVTGTATLISNKQIDMAAGTSASIVTISGTLDLAGYVLSGSTGVTLTGGTGTLKTSHADGISGNLTNSGTNSLTSGTVDHSSASPQTISVANYGSITNTGGGARTLGAGTIKIAGTFTTGAGNYTIGTGTVEFNGSTAQTIPVVPVASGSNYYNFKHSGTSSATLAGSISVANDVTLSGTNANSNVYLTDGTARTLTINGNLILTDGTLDFAATGATASGIVELKGNLTQTAGITYTTEALANGQIRFSGAGSTSSPQTITLTSNNTFQYTNLTVSTGTVVKVNSGIILSGSSNANYTGTLTVNGDLDLQGNAITSDGTTGSNNATFVLSSGATLITSSTTGLLEAIPASFMTRTFNSAANYEFSGSAAITNTNFSNTTMNNLTISNTAGVTLGGSATINGVLDLSGGKLAIGSNTLTLAGTVSSMSATNCLTGSSGSNLTINGTGALGTLYFNQATPGTTDNIATFTLNRTSSGTAALGSNLRIGTSLVNTSGKLAIGSNTLTLNGTVSSMSASNCLTGSSGSNLTITGTGALGTLFLDQTTPGTTDNLGTFTLNRTSSGTATLGSNASIGTALALTNGTLDLNTATLTYSGSSISRTSGAIDADGGGGAGGISFTNTSAVSIPASSFTGNINNWTMNGTGGVTINDNQSIAGTLTLTSGILTVGNNTITLTGSISGGGSSSYIQTNGTGKLTRNGITTSTLFPVGNAKYNPVTINNVNNLNWSVKISDGITPDPGFPATGRVDLIWDITPSTNPPSSATSITFQYDATSQVGPDYSSINANMQAFHRNRYDEYWLPTGNTAAADQTVPTATTVTITGLTSFSKYALSKVGSPLPVTLLSFSGYKDGVRNQLRWVTATETNNTGFQLERSIDGLNYQSIGFVSTLAIGGNSQAQLKYSFTDANPAGIKHYYRLRQLDIDGRSNLSNILLLQGEKPTAFEITSVFPNPSCGQITLLLSAPANENIRIRLFDVSGRVIETRQVNVLTGNNSIPFDLSKQAKGQYLIQVGEKVVRVVRE